MTVNVKTKADLARCEQRYHEHFSSQFYNGMMHTRPCRVKSPCVEKVPTTDVYEEMETEICEEIVEETSIGRQKNIEENEIDENKQKVRRSSRNMIKTINYAENISDSSTEYIETETPNSMTADMQVNIETKNTTTYDDKMKTQIC